MHAVAILREETGQEHSPRFRAIARNSDVVESQGRSAGEAFDAIWEKLGPDRYPAVIIVQQMRPDEFFTQDQMDRLGTLTDRLRIGDITSTERAELEALVEIELAASANRSKILADILHQWTSSTRQSRSAQRTAANTVMRLKPHLTFPSKWNT